MLIELAIPPKPVAGHNRSAPRKRAANLLGPTHADTAVIDAAIAAIWPCIDKISYGWRDGDGKPQVSREALNQHFAAAFRKKWCTAGQAKPSAYVSPLTQKDLAKSLAQNDPIYFRSSWSGGILWVRLDVDTHRGQTDGQALMDLFKGYLPTVYCCPSARGISGYVGLTVPTGISEEGEVIPSCSMPEMNRLREQMHVAAQAIAKHHGFAAAIEMHGSFLQRQNPEKDENGLPLGPQTVAEGALGPRTMVKLPTFETVQDVERFAAAIIKVDPRSPDRHDAGLSRFFADAKALPPAPATSASTTIDPFHSPDARFDDLPDAFKEAAVKALGFHDNWQDFTDEQVLAVLAWKPAGRKRSGPLSRIILPDPTGDIMADTRACVARAKQLLGYGHPGIVELGMDLYEENHLERDADGRDKKRVSRFKAAALWMDKTNDPSRASKGSDPNWYDDLEFLKEKMIGAGAPAMIEQFNESRLGRRGKLDLDYVADIACMLAKAIVVHKDGAPNETHTVSTKTLAGTMRKHGRSDDGSLIAAAKKITIATGCIKVVAAAVKLTLESINGVKHIAGRATQYAIEKWNWFTFLAHHAPDAPVKPKQPAPCPKAVKAAKEIAAHDIYAAGPPFFVSQIKGNSSSSPAHPESPEGLFQAFHRAVSTFLHGKSSFATN